MIAAWLLALQLDELVAGSDRERELLVRDYLAVPPSGERRSAGDVLSELDALSGPALLDLGSVSRALGLGGCDALDAAVSPRGYRLLAKVPRLPPSGGGRPGGSFRWAAEAAGRERDRPARGRRS
jgi:diadenylate cyclase